MAKDKNVVPGAIRPRILLALDYGVSFTSLADSMSDGSPVDPDLLRSSNWIAVFREWPGVSPRRVPSEIPYSPTDPEKYFPKWGWSIDDNLRVLKYTKLELEAQSTLEGLLSLQRPFQGLDLIEELQTNKDVPLMNDVPIHLTKRAEDAVTDYLSKVTRVLWQHMRGQRRYTLECVPLDLMITYPDRWSYDMMNKLYRAVKCTFTTTMFPTLRNISFVSEMECWVLRTLQEMMHALYDDIFTPGECFVICHVAQCKAEATSYCIDKLEPLEISRSGTHLQSMYGKDFIENCFLKFLQHRILDLGLSNDSLLGSEGDMVFKPRTRVLLEQFEQIQHAFNGTGDALLTIPRGMRVAPGFEDTVDNGILRVTEQNLKDFFSGTLNGILQLLVRQITNVRNTKHNGMRREVPNILMVGELLENEYIFSEVTKFVNRSGDCQVYMANDYWASAVNPTKARI